MCHVVCHAVLLVMEMILFQTHLFTYTLHAQKYLWWEKRLSPSRSSYCGSRQQMLLSCELRTVCTDIIHVKSPAFARRLLKIHQISWKGEPISWIFSETKIHFFFCYFPNSAWPNWVLFPADSSMFFLSQQKMVNTGSDWPDFPRLPDFV